MKKFMALTLASLLILGMTAVLPVAAANYDAVYDQTFTTYANVTAATTALKTYWNAGAYNNLSGAPAANIAWSAANGFQFQWSNFVQISTKTALSKYRLTTQLKTNTSQWAGIAIRESLSKVDLPGASPTTYAGSSTQGITFTIACNPALTTTMSVVIRESTGTAPIIASVPFPGGASNYFGTGSGGAFRNVVITDTPEEITFSSDGTLIARIAIDTTSKINGNYNKGEVFDGSGTSKVQFTTANIPASGMVDIFTRANNSWIKSLKVELERTVDAFIPLSAKIVEAQGYQESLYTSASFAVLTQKILDGQALITGGIDNATMVQINSAISAIDNAIVGLVSPLSLVPTNEYVDVYSENFNSALSTDKMNADWIRRFVGATTDGLMFAGDGVAKVRWNLDGTAGNGSILVTNKMHQNYKLETNLKVTTIGNSSTLSLRNPSDVLALNDLREGDVATRPGKQGIMLLFGGYGIASNEFAIVFKNGTSTTKSEYILKYNPNVNILTNTTVTVYDLDDKVYIYMGGIPAARIELSGLVDGIYTSGSVYNAKNVLVGTPFTGMVVGSSGHIGYSTRTGGIDVDDITVSQLLNPAQTVTTGSFDKTAWGTGDSEGNTATLGFIAGDGYTVNLSVKVDKSLGRSTIALKDKAGNIVDSKKIDCFFVTETWVDVTLTVPTKGEYTLEITAEGSNYSQIANADIQFNEGLGASTAGNSIIFDGVTINRGVL